VSFLLDTNVVSDLRRAARTHAALHRWFTLQPPETLYLSVITLGEIRQGIEQLRPRDARQAVSLGQWLDDLARRYSDRLLPIDSAVADEWGRLRAVRPLPVVDAFLGATARVHGLTLVTRKERNFRGLDVAVLNPINLGHPNGR
jgi:predicted nucleic acid-binding protein